MSSDNSLVIMKFPRNPGIVIAQQDDFILSFLYLRMIEGTRKGWKPSCFAHEYLIAKISADHHQWERKITYWWSIEHNGITNHGNMSNWFIIWIKCYRIIILINECIIRIPSIFNRRNGVDSLLFGGWLFDERNGHFVQ